MSGDHDDDKQTQHPEISTQVRWGWRMQTSREASSFLHSGQESSSRLSSARALGKNVVAVFQLVGKPVMSRRRRRQTPTANHTCQESPEDIILHSRKKVILFIKKKSGKGRDVRWVIGAGRDLGLTWELDLSHLLSSSGRTQKWCRPSWCCSCRPSRSLCSTPHTGWPGPRGGRPPGRWR